MAKIVSVTNFYASTAANTTAAALTTLGEHATDDDIFICVGHDGAGTGAITMTTGTGWTEVVTQAASDDTRSTVFRKRVTAPETVPVFSANGVLSEEWSGTVFVMRGFNATTPVAHWHRVDVSNTNSWNSNGGVAGSTLAASSIAGPTAATFTDGQVLVVYAHADSPQPLSPDIGVLTEIGKSRDATSTSHIVGFKTLNGTGTVPNVVIRGNVTGATEGGVCYALVLNPATSSDTLACATADVTVIAYLGDIGTFHDQTITWGTPASRSATSGGPVTGDKILNIDLGATAITPTTSTGAENTSSPWGAVSLWSTSANLGTAAWTGGIGTLTNVVSLSGKMLTFQMSTSYLANAAPTGAEGIGVYLEDNASHWSFFQLRKSNTMPYSGELFTPMFDPSDALRSAGSGTLDLTNIKYIGFMAHRLAGSASARTFAVKSILAVGKTTFFGGGTTDPTTWDAAIRCLTSWSMIGPAVRHLASTDQFQIKQNSDIGDGTNAVVFSSSATSMAFPSGWDNTSGSLSDYKATIGPGGKNITLVGGTGSALVLDGSLISADSDTAVEFTVDASYVGTVSASGCTLSGYTFTDSKGLSWNGLTIQNGGTATLAAGADLTNCTVQKTTSTNAALAVTANGTALTGCTIDGTGAAYALELGTAVTAVTLASSTITAGSTDKVHVLKTTGTVTITISGTTSLVAGDITSAGATVVIAAPQPTLDATVLASSRVVLYNNTTAAELDNTAPGGTSWSKVITSGASANDSLTLHVFKEGYEEFSTTFLYTGDDATILVTQAADANLTSLRTELSITDYTTITEFALDITGTVEIDADDADGSSQKARLAIWYNGVLTTENGARYLRGAITILSTAAFRINTSVLNLKIENISATYGLNFTDTERRLYRDDGAAIYAAASAPGSIQNDYSGVPDTVETGVSGLTGSESAQLMALPSASTIASTVATQSQSTPFHADARKMNGATITGTGISSDLWRGA